MRKQFEYLVLRKPLYEKELNELGKEGWKLVSIVNELIPVFYFIRELKKRKTYESCKVSKPMSLPKIQEYESRGWCLIQIDTEFYYFVREVL